MELKRKRSKVSYTVMIISDSAKKRMKSFHVKAGVAGIVTAFIFILAVFFICYVVYSSITLSDSLERSKKQSEQIAQLKEENAALQSEKDSLAGKVSILSETVNQKVEMEQALAAEQEEAHLPKGFPLSGSAQIKAENAEEAEDADAEDDGEDNQDAEQENTTDNTETKEIVFTAGAGINVIASGAGTVTDISGDVEFGNMIGIDHGNGYITTYRNGGNPMVRVGDEVSRGAILYVIGEENTELGYAIKQEDTYIDPMEMIEING